MHFNFLLKNLLFINTSFFSFLRGDADSQNQNECSKIFDYFDSKQDNLMNIDYCEDDDNGKMKVLYLIQNSDFELSEEDIDEITSYKSVELLSIRDFTMTQYLIDKISENKNLASLHIASTGFEQNLDYSPFEKLNDNKLNEIKLYYNWYDGNIFDKLNMLSNLKFITLFDEDVSLSHINSIAKFKNIESLELVSWNGLNDDISFKPLEKLEKLEKIKVVTYGGKLKDNLIKSFKNVKSVFLEEIDFSQNNIKELSKLTKLTELIIENNDFPDSLDLSPLKSLKNLEHLKLESRDEDKIKLRSIPSFILSLSKLKKLELFGQKISKLPTNLKNLKNLEYIDLSNNRIDDEIPDSYNDLSNLKYFNVKGNRDIKGKTLTNKKLKECYYEPNYSLCKAKNMDCLEDSGISFVECISEDDESKDGRCGNGRGKCPSGKCCSKYGWCGTTENHCSVSAGCQSEFGKCDKEEGSDEVEIKCGKGLGKCPDGQCCSKNGVCGTSNEFCSKDNGCQIKYGTCASELPYSVDGRCGKNDGRCPKNNCCSKHGWCGTSEGHCSIAAGCQSEFGTCH